MSWANVNPNTRRLAQTILTTRQLRIVQHRIDGHSWNTIAHALGISKSTARSHYQTAIRKLANALKEAA